MLDCDGVLLDYHEAYQRAWKKAFGGDCALRNPNAYWARDRFDVPLLDQPGRAYFNQSRGEDFWSSMLPIGGALDACNRLVSAGHRLVCVTAVDSHYQSARIRNLQACGFPIDAVIAAPDSGNGINPKAAPLARLAPAAFVDDFAPYLRDLPAGIHRALILRETEGSPNVGELLTLADSTHLNLAKFATAWCDKLA